MMGCMVYDWSGTQEFPGTLADAAPGREEQGFLSFSRLMVLFTLRNTYIVEFSHTTPCALYT